MSANTDDRFARSEDDASATDAPSTTESSVAAETDGSGACSHPSSSGKACDGRDDGNATKGKGKFSSPRQSLISTKNGAVAKSPPGHPEVVPTTLPDFVCGGARSSPSSSGRKGRDVSKKGSYTVKGKGELSSTRLPEASRSIKNSAVTKSLPDCPEVVPASEPDSYSLAPANNNDTVAKSLPDRPEVVPVSEPDFYSPSPSTAHHSVSVPWSGSGDGGSIGMMPLPSTDAGAGIEVGSGAGIEVEVDIAAAEEDRAPRSTAENSVAAAVTGFLAEEAGGGGRRGEEGLVAARERMLQDAPLVYGEQVEVEEASDNGKSWLGKHRRLAVAAAALVLALAATIAAVLATQLPSRYSNDANNGALPPSQGDESSGDVEEGGTPYFGNISSLPYPMPMPPLICSTKRCQSIKSVLEPLVANSSSLEDATSPQARALLWLADEDVRRVENVQDTFNLTQRFAVATVYFATGGGENMWREEAHFLSGEHVCEWHAWAAEIIGIHDETAEKGVSCYGTNVVMMLNLAHNNLTGAIPEEISLLPHLQAFVMSDNKIGGSIPGAVSSLDNLQLLLLGINQIEGTIPNNMSSSLVYLDLSVNELIGPVPPLANLTKLTALSLPFNYLTSTLPSLSDKPDLGLLWLSSNYFEGPLPPSVSNLTSLRQLAANDNSITGTVPFEAELSLELLNLSRNRMNGTTDAAIDHLPNVSQLGLSWNSLTGTLPDRMWELSNVETIDLNNNLLSGTLSPQVSNLNRTLLSFNIRVNFLNGTIPPSIVALKNLEAGLILSENNFGGGIPTDIGNLEKLEALSLWANNLSGSIPSSIGNMTNMNLLWLTMNALTGTVPRSFAQLTNLNFMSIDRNALTGNIDFLCDLGMKLIEADCLAGLENSSLIECSCCGRCCDAVTGVCDPPYSSSGL